MAEKVTDQRQRIVRAAVDLLTRGGRDAVSTRAVCAAAGVQPPTIYRQFSDMQGLLHAAAREVMATYVRRKATRTQSADPIDELRHGWDMHVAFGLANPAAYSLIYGDSASDAEPPEVREGNAFLHALLARVAEAGRLRVSVPHAAWLMRAAGCGVTLSLVASPPNERDLGMSDRMRDIVFDAILSAPLSKETRGADRVAARAIALQAVLSEASDVLSANERLLLAEWLERLATVDRKAAPRRVRKRA